MNSLKKGGGIPLLNLEEGPGVPSLNFEGAPGVPLLNFREVPGPTFKLGGGPGSWVSGFRSLGSRGPCLTFTPWRFVTYEKSIDNDLEHRKIFPTFLCVRKGVHFW